MSSKYLNNTNFLCGKILTFLSPKIILQTAFYSLFKSYGMPLNPSLLLYFISHPWLFKATIWDRITDRQTDKDNLIKQFIYLTRPVHSYHYRISLIDRFLLYSKCPSAVALHYLLISCKASLESKLILPSGENWSRFAGCLLQLQQKPTGQRFDLTWPQNINTTYLPQPTSTSYFP